ncbi:hypothetical protein CI102_15254 [Trichoderma harzianum]|nr:hypothetical protein CI102_15254 [Trichoderma harzianum]
MIAASSDICNFGRGAYDTTGLPKPPPPQPQHSPSTNERTLRNDLNKAFHTQNVLRPPA